MLAGVQVLNFASKTHLQSPTGLLNSIDLFVNIRLDDNLMELNLG